MKKQNSKISKDKEVKVLIHIPENISDSVKRRKINQIYDILNSQKINMGLENTLGL